MLKSILALVLVLSTQSIANDTPDLCPAPSLGLSLSTTEETQQTQETQNSSAYSLWGSLTSCASSAFSSLQEGTKNATKKVLRHVYSNLPFYSTIGGVCLAAASMTTANAFSVDNDCPGFYTGTYQEWHCPPKIWLCSNGDRTPNVPFAFVGCPEKIELNIWQNEVLSDTCDPSDKECLLQYERFQPVEHDYNKFLEVWTNAYDMLKKNITIFSDGQCAFPLTLMLKNLGQSCIYDLSNFMGAGLLSHPRAEFSIPHRIKEEL